MKLAVATCQFPATGDIRRNLGFVLRQMKTAKQRGAQVAHFPEVGLSGYGGVDFDSLEDFDWDLLTESTRKIMALAKELGLWVILGSSHRLSGKHKPHNSLYIINDRGQIADRYDKMFCTGSPGNLHGDLKYYSPGNHFCVFKIGGIRCGTLICHDYRYQELYREYKKRGVQLVFHSYYIGGHDPAELRKENIWEVIVPATMQTYAANNHIWISANTTTSPASAIGSFFVRPQGMITGLLPKDKAAVLISTVDTEAQYNDKSRDWRGRAMRGIYHSGRLVRDKRSSNRKSL